MEGLSLRVDGVGVDSRSPQAGHAHAQPLLDPSSADPDHPAPHHPAHQRQLQHADSPKSGDRLYSLDLMRGLIMMVMAWDHTKDLVSNGVLPHSPGSESWSGPFTDYDGDGWLVLSRMISHFCAPGFFFTMGIGMVMFSVSRFNRGWAATRIIKHFLLRGFVLLICGRLINVTQLAGLVRPNSWAFRFQGSLPLLEIFQVMTALGLTMMTLAFFVPLMLHIRKRSTQDAPSLSETKPNIPSFTAGEGLAIVLAVVNFVISNVFIVRAQTPDNLANGYGWPRYYQPAHTVGQFALRFLLYPGLFGTEDTPKGIIMYPLIPWLGIALLGCAAGFEWTSAPRRAERRCLPLAVISAAVFSVIRSAGGEVGNFRGWPRGELHSMPVISVLWISKYPPDVAYTSLTLFIDLLLLYAFSFYPFQNRWATTLSKPLMVYGQTPLFFYVLHFFLLTALGAAIHIDTNGLYLAWALPIWVGVLITLYPLCQRFGRFKRSTAPESLWRLL